MDKTLETQREKEQPCLPGWRGQCPRPESVPGGTMANGIYF